MNFDPMPIVNEHSDITFWYIAVPVMMTTLLLMSTRVDRYGPMAWMRRRRINKQTRLLREKQKHE